MTTTTKKYPTPLYAVAGASDYAYQQLRKLPAKLTELRDRVAANQRPVRPDLERFREVARRNTEQVLGEARTVYADLVARGERVVDGPAAAVAVLEPAEETVAEAAKPVKRARPTTRK